MLEAVSEKNKDEKMRFDGFYALFSLTKAKSKKAKRMFQEIVDNGSYWDEVKNACFSVLIKFKEQLNVNLILNNNNNI